jgi:hypothetical protein
VNNEALVLIIYSFNMQVWLLPIWISVNITVNIYMWTESLFTTCEEFILVTITEFNEEFYFHGLFQSEQILCQFGFVYAWLL